MTLGASAQACMGGQGRVTSACDQAVIQAGNGGHQVGKPGASAMVQLRPGGDIPGQAEMGVKGRKFRLPPCSGDHEGHAHQGVHRVLCMAPGSELRVIVRAAGGIRT